MDVIWTAEYAASGLALRPHPGRRRARKRVHPLDGGNGRIRRQEVGAARSTPTPASSSTGPTKCRNRRRPGRTSTKQAQEKNGLVYQGERYEGLTVDFLELLYSAGGKVLSDDGETVEIDSPETREALEFMARRRRRRRGAEGGHDLRRGELEARLRGRQRDLHAQLALRLRARQRIEHRRRIRQSRSSRASAATRAPAWSAATTSAISAFTDNPDGSLAFAEFLVTEPVQKEMFIKATLPAVATAVYKDPEVKKADPVHRRTAESGRTGPGPSGLSGLHGNLRSDLRQRLRSPQRQSSPPTRRPRR